MKEQKTTNTIGRNNYGYYFIDSSYDVEATTMIEVFGLLISRLAATLQYDADSKNTASYKIDIKRRKE